MREARGGSAAASADMGVQTGATFDRLAVILKSEGLSLGDMFRTFMFMPDLSVRTAYGEARRKKYKDIFKLEEYPANSGIGLKAWGKTSCCDPWRSLLGTGRKPLS